MTLYVSPKQNVHGWSKGKKTKQQSKYQTTPNWEGEKSKLTINDMTKLSVPDPSDYCFQFEPLRDDQSQKRSLKEVVEQSSHMDVVTVSGKILLKSETEIVGKDFLKLAKATLSDGVTTIGLELWEDIIDKIIEGQTYTVSNARVRIWNKKKKLSTTKIQSSKIMMMKIL